MHRLTAAPNAAEYLPASHSVHAVDPEAVAYLPAAHNVQLALPNSEYMPGGHMRTAVAPPVTATTPLRAAFVTQVTPESADWYMDPPVLNVPAASLLKSGEAVMPNQYLLPAPARLFHVTPLLVETYMLPLSRVAASLVKSGVEVIPLQTFWLGFAKAVVHVAPPLIDI
jgi:hypothetical protein